MCSLPQVHLATLCVPLCTLETCVFPLPQVEVRADQPRPDLVLHWAVNDWQLPPEDVRPPSSWQAGDKAVQTPFQGGQAVHITFPEVRAGVNKRLLTLAHGVGVLSSSLECSALPYSPACRAEEQ